MVADSSPRLADATDTTKRAGRAARKHVQQQLVGKRGQHMAFASSKEPVKELSESGKGNYGVAPWR
jgi:hypothetical protein